MTATDILRLLEARHSSDVFIPECKDGASQGITHLRMDAWVMRRSWSNPLVTAYEIKVSRQDFLRDEKWHQYLDYCNQFYFACPPGLIAPEELPAEAGLLYAAKTGIRLYTKKKAPRREVKIPESLFRYIVMCRSTFIKEHQQQPKDRLEYWKKYLAEKEERKHVGYLVSQTVQEYVRRTEQENIRLKNTMTNYDYMVEHLKGLGFDPKQNINAWEFRNKLDELTGQLPRGTAGLIDDTISRMQKIKQVLYPPIEE